MGVMTMSSVDLLPSNATPLERAVSSLSTRISDIPVSIQRLWSPQECPASLLPWLAQTVAVQAYDPNWTEEQKRAAIAASIDVHKKNGTIGAVKRAIEALGYDVAIDDKTGEPYTFRIRFDFSQIGAVGTDTYNAARRVALKTKNLRSHLAGIDAYKEVSLGVYVGAAAVRADDVDIEFSGLEPYIYDQSGSAAIQPGYPFSLYVHYIGSEGVTCQWYKDDEAIPGATNATYAVDEASNSDFGVYYAVLSNQFGSDQSEQIIVASAPYFATQPQSYVGLWGNDVTFTVVVIGNEPILYQWYKDGVAITGANTTSYTRSDVDEDDEGVYTCRATNENGSTFSDEAVIDIQFPAPDVVALSNTVPNVIHILWGEYSNAQVVVNLYELQYSIDGGTWNVLYSGYNETGVYEVQQGVSTTGNYLYRLRVRSGSRYSEWSESVAFNVDEGVVNGLYINCTLDSNSSFVSPIVSSDTEQLSINCTLDSNSSFVSPIVSSDTEQLSIISTVEGSYETE